MHWLLCGRNLCPFSPSSSLCFNGSKYYDDCSQILSEHILASVKPAALKTFSTLDPLVTTSLNRHSAADLAAAARKLKACMDENKANLSGSLTPPIDNMSNASSDNKTSELLKSAAATLIEGALPVREFPSNLTSEPASISQSGNSSVVDTPKTLSAGSAMGTETHEEELRCVIAIVRHGDRTPKQKLKANMKEPHILEYFHKQ